MPKIPGIPHLRAVAALEKAGFSIVRQGKHIVMSDGTRIVTIPRHNPINAFTMGGVARDAGLTVEEFLRLVYCEGHSRSNHRLHLEKPQGVVPGVRVCSGLRVKRVVGVRHEVAKIAVLTAALIGRNSARCSAICLLPQHASPATVRCEACGTT